MNDTPNNMNANNNNFSNMGNQSPTSRSTFNSQPPSLPTAPVPDFDPVPLKTSSNYSGNVV